MEKLNLVKFFGSKVFNDQAMRERLEEDTYLSLKKTIEDGDTLNTDIAQEVADAMKDWAIEQGATHFTHWFQPLTGITAEKHDSFITPTKDGKILMEFSAKALIKGESDASSFPSGGLRATFEARGYTAWDPTSYAFVRGTTLYIPTIFCSYSGEVLDKKAPLLRSIKALGDASLSILRLFGNETTKYVYPTVGPEQEYFLISKTLFSQRKDLIFTGRTLFGAMPPKGQELDDHYYGSLKDLVYNYMAELDKDLWELGISAKTRHNEVAPAQHELASVFSNSNIATDHNQVTMDVMKKVAERNGLSCLLHEKPFKGVNGSGKHNNWSLATDDGQNLLKPGDSPSKNAQFLLFLCAVIKAVDEYADLLRAATSSAGNDHRLGANEAPPAIVSMFIGSDLELILDAIESDTPIETSKYKGTIKVGVDSLPHIFQDATDRNRTSPFAFTGNKFEFRMLGSSDSIADVNVVLNTIVAEELTQFYDELKGAENFEETLNHLIKRVIKDHKRIIFNGNNYSYEWRQEAEKRGLKNLKTTPDALPYFIEQKNIDLFVKHHIFSESEVYSRYEIMMMAYCKTVHIEAQTMVEMVNQEIMPAAVEYGNMLAAGLSQKLEVNIPCDADRQLAESIGAMTVKLFDANKQLKEAISACNSIRETKEKMDYACKNLIPLMEKLRRVADQLETNVGSDYWPYPTYSDLLFNI